MFAREIGLCLDTVRQSKDNNTGFIKLIHYWNNIPVRNDIIVEAMLKLKYKIIEKAQNGKSKYMAYIKNNPNFKRSQIYDQVYKLVNYKK